MIYTDVGLAFVGGKKSLRGKVKATEGHLREREIDRARGDIVLLLDTGVPARHQLANTRDPRDVRRAANYSVTRRRRRRPCCPWPRRVFAGCHVQPWPHIIITLQTQTVNAARRTATGGGRRLRAKSYLLLSSRRRGGSYRAPENSAAVIQHVANTTATSSIVTRRADQVRNNDCARRPHPR